MKKSFVLSETLAGQMRLELLKQNRLARVINDLTGKGVDLSSDNGMRLIQMCIDAEATYRALFAQAILDACVGGVELRNQAKISFWPLQGVLSWEEEVTIADEPDLAPPVSGGVVTFGDDEAASVDVAVEDSEATAASAVAPGAIYDEASYLEAGENTESDGIDQGQDQPAALETEE